MLLLLATACLPGPQPNDVPEFVDLEPATISTLVFACQLDRERRRLEVTTEFWSGGGRLWLTQDGQYVEEHGVRSVLAEPDGSADFLRLDLALVGDWREAAPDSSTAFLCPDNPNGLFVLYDLDGETELECRFWGPDSSVWNDVEELPSCADIIDAGE